MSTEKKESLIKRGRRLKEARKRLGFTQGYLGQLVGCTGGNISSIERGDWGASGPLLKSLARALGAEENYLSLETDVAPYEKGAGTPPIVSERGEESLAAKRHRLVKQIKELAITADEGVIDALLKNVEQFSRIKKEEQR